MNTSDRLTKTIQLQEWFYEIKKVIGGTIFLLALVCFTLAQDEMSAICILMFQVWKPEQRTES